MATKREKKRGKIGDKVLQLGKWTHSATEKKRGKGH